MKRQSLALPPGCSQPHFQWRHNQIPIPGASGTCTLDGGNGWLASLTLNNVQRQNAGFYSVVFWNEYGAISSSSDHSDTELIVNGTAPVEITPHSTQVHNPNVAVVLTLTTSFDAACVQWVKFDLSIGDWIPISNNDPDPMKCVIQSPITFTCSDQGYYSVMVYDSSHWPYPPPDVATSPAVATVLVDGCDQ